MSGAKSSAIESTSKTDSRLIGISGRVDSRSVGDRRGNRNVSGDGHGFAGDGAEDAVLATGTDPANRLSANGGVVDDSSQLDVIVDALAGLVVGREAPGVDLPILRDGERVIGTAGGIDGIVNVYAIG